MNIKNYLGHCFHAIILKKCMTITSYLKLPFAVHNLIIVQANIFMLTELFTIMLFRLLYDNCRYKLKQIYIYKAADLVKIT